MKGTKMLAAIAAAAAFTILGGMSVLAGYSDGIEVRSINLDGYDEETSIRYGYGYIQTIGLVDGKDSQTYPELARGLVAWSEDMKNTRTEAFDSMVEGFKEYYNEAMGSQEVSMEVDMLPRRADDTVFSFLEYYQDYAGGAHGYYMYTGHNFDPATGEELTLDQIVKDEDAFRSAVKQALAQKYPDSSIGTLGNPIESYGSGQDQYPFNWVMGADAVSVYFNPYDIGSYAEGVFVVDLRFADYPDLFTDRCQTAQGGYGMRFETWTTERIDLNQDGDHSELLVGFESSSPDVSDWYDVLTVKVDDVTCKAGNQSFYAAEPFLMKTADGKYYLYVVMEEENDYRETAIFGFMDNSPYLVGVVRGGFGFVFDEKTWQSISIFPSDPEHFMMSTRGDLLSTYTISRYYRTGEDGMPQPLEEFYTCSSNTPLRTVMPLPVQPLNPDTLKPEGEKTTVPAGEELKIRRTDGETAVDLEREDGSMVRVNLDGTRWPRTIDGVEEGNYFEQLYYAG